MEPSNERFESDDVARFNAHDRLIKHAQLIALDRVTQLRFESQPRHCFGAHVRVENLRAGAALRFRAIHRRVGVAQNLLRVFVFVAGDRDADARRREHFRAADPERRGDFVLHTD